MPKTKQFINIILFLIMTIALTACKSLHKATESPDENNTSFHQAESLTADGSEQKEISTDNGTQHINKHISDYVTIDADVDIPEALQSLRMKKVKAARPLIDEQLMISTFFKEEAELNRHVDSGYKSREFGNYDMYNLNDKDDNFLSLASANIMYSASDMNYIYNCVFDDRQFPDYNLDKYQKADDLSFASRSEVFHLIKKVYESIGIEISDDYEVYVLDHDTLKKEENPVDSEGKVLDDERKKEWTPDDDAYYFVFHQEVQGVPIKQLAYGDGYTGTGIEETELKAVYGARGWMEFTEEWGYELKNTKEEISIIGIDEAMQALEKKCDMLISDQQWNIDKIELGLLPVFIKDNEYEIHPIWYFSGKIVHENDIETELAIMFDGINGKEIVS